MTDQPRKICASCIWLDGEICDVPVIKGCAIHSPRPKVQYDNSCEKWEPMK